MSPSHAVCVVRHTFLEFRRDSGDIIPVRKRTVSDTGLDLPDSPVQEKPCRDDAASDDDMSSASTHLPAELDEQGSAKSGAQQHSPRMSWADETLDCGEAQKTTVMFRNVPNDYSRDMFVAMLEEEGFAGEFDFVYLPIDFSSRSGFGYAFINLVSPEAAGRFREHFDGFSKWALPSHKVAEVTWSNPSQGLATHIERYRNSPVMHEAVRDEFRPIMMKDGVRVPFPEPTKAIKMPRIRQSTKRHEAFRSRRGH